MRRTILFVFSCVTLLSPSLFSQIPRTLSYQGVLTDSLGNPTPDGSYVFKFSLYNGPVGGSSVWSETKTLSVKRGLFTAALGEVTPFPESFSFKSQLWLGISVSNSPELSPKIALQSVPASFWSRSADSAGTVSDNSITSAKIANGAIQRIDVAANFTAPYSDTAAYARVAPQTGIADSARIAGTISDNSVTSSKIVNGTILFADVARNGAASGQVMKWNGSAWIAGNDSVGSAGSGSQWTSSGSDIYYVSGKVGIGVNPAITDGVLDVGGRILIRSGGNLSTSAGSWLNNVDNTALSAFVGMENDSSVGIYGAGGAGWAFGVNTRTRDVKMFGRLGIGTATPSAPLSFPAWTGKKITLYPGTFGDAGFGVFGNELRINSDYSGADITFGYDDYTQGFTERMRIKGNGNVGIGTSTPNAPLGFPPTTGKKITLYPGASSDYSIGVFDYELRINIEHSGADVTFGYDDIASGFIERMRIKGNGNVGIGTSDPTGTLAITSSGDFNNPQLLLNQAVGTDWARIRMTSTKKGGTSRFWDIAGFIGGASAQDRLNISNSSGSGTFGVGGNGALYVNNDAGQPAQVLTSEGANTPAHWAPMSNIILTYYNNTLQNSGELTASTTDFVFNHVYTITVAANSRLILSGNFSISAWGGGSSQDLINVRINGTTVQDYFCMNQLGLMYPLSISNFMYDISPGTYIIDFQVHHIAVSAATASATIKTSSLMVMPR